MNKYFVNAVLMLLLVASPVAIAQGGKIAVVDMQRAILSTDEAKDRLKKLRSDRDYAANRKEAQKLQKEMEAMAKALQKDMAILSAEQRQHKGEKIQQKRADIEHLARKLQSAEEKLVKELVVEVRPMLQEVMGQLIESEKIGLLLDRQATHHVSAEYDITAKVTDKLNRKF